MNKKKKKQGLLFDLVETGLFLVPMVQLGQYIAWPFCPDKSQRTN